MKSFSNKRMSFRRRVLLSAGVLTLLGCLTATISSCGAALPDIQEGFCGNRVVEPENGEDCEEPDEDAEQEGVVLGKCGKSGSYAPCRYICNDTVSCDPGYGCGLDGICRQAGGLSDLPFSIGGTGARQLFRGDFDGDGRHEIVAANGNTATVHFLTSEGFISASKSYPYGAGTPAIGDLDGDGLSDMVLNLGQSMSIWLGRDDRTLVPRTQPIMYASDLTHRLIPLGSYTNDGYILALADIAGPEGATFIQFTPDGGHRRLPILNNNFKPGRLQGVIATRGEVNIEGKSCGVIVGEFEGIDSRVSAARRCEGADLIEVLWELFLGAKNKPWAGTYLRDLDNDGIDELLFGVNFDNDAYQSLVFDKFDANGMPMMAPKTILDHTPGNCMSTPAQLASAPLAIADLNRDGHIDFVDNRGVLLYDANKSPKPYDRICHPYQFIEPMADPAIVVSWTSAVVGDINGDGLPDLLASRKGQNILDLWMWKPEGLATIPISIPGPALDLVMGDLDGDTISDVGFRISPPMEDALSPTPVFVMFGNPSALPSAPQSVGVIPGVKQLVMGRLQGANQLQQPDIYDDLLVLAQDRPAPGAMPSNRSPLTLIQGSASRTLFAPLILQEDTRANSPLDPITGTLPPREIRGLTISDFGMPPDYMNQDGLDPSNIIVLAGKDIWTAGFDPNGSSFIIKGGLDTGNDSGIFAPVDDFNATTSSLNQTTQLATFADTMKEGPALSFLEQTGTGTFTGLEMITGLEPDVRLPSALQPDVPFVFADLDANGKRDVVLLAPKATKDNTKESIVVYWNGDTDPVSLPFDLYKQTEFLFNPTLVPDVPVMDQAQIQDIAALNYDDDVFLELAILTRAGIYIAKIDLEAAPKEPTDGYRPQVKADRQFSLLMGSAAIAEVMGGDALLAVDANSDGIDDLVVGDIGKLLLFFGSERQKQ